MRRAELVMALAMAVLSLYLMWKSAELPIGWIPNEGPGGGAFPFWLAAGMLICTVVIIVRWFRGRSPLSHSVRPFMDSHGFSLFIAGAGSLTVMVGLIHFIGVYGSVPLYLAFYMRFMGNHRWLTTGAIALATPVIAFFFFEITLNISLPKGYTEPLFYPLYDIFL
ncbi:MAG: tripartite tricarboxylate transporter TctB family protein [Alphaproteobacteria bacterium]